MNSQRHQRLRRQREGRILMEQMIEYLGEEVGPPTRGRQQLNGLTIPAHALEWLSQTLEQNNSSNNNDDPQLQLLQTLLPHAKKIRITIDPWPRKKQQQQQPKRPASVHIGLFPNLQILWLDRVPLEWLVSSSLGKLTVLRVTHSRNPLQLLKHIPTFPRLSHLQLANCGIDSSSTDDQDDASCAAAEVFWTQLLLPSSNFQYLDLSHNRITLWPPPNAITNNHCNITTLKLSHNDLESIHPQIVHIMPHLRQLWLDHNALTDLHQTANILAGLHQLQELHLVLAGTNDEWNDTTSSYRLIVWHAFCERRLALKYQHHNNLLTLRNVQAMLPRIDGQQATLSELRQLRQRTIPRVGVACVNVQQKRRRKPAVLIRERGHRSVRPHPSCYEPATVSFTLEQAVALTASPVSVLVDGIPADLLQQQHSTWTEEEDYHDENDAMLYWEGLTENVGDIYREAIQNKHDVIWPSERKELSRPEQQKSSTTIGAPEGHDMEEEKSRFENMSLSRSDLDTTTLSGNELTTTLQQDAMEPLKTSGVTTVTTAATGQSNPPPAAASVASAQSAADSKSHNKSFSGLLSAGSSDMLMSIQTPLRMSTTNSMIWQEDNESVLSSLGGGGMQDGSPLSRREVFWLAEQNSEYHGPLVHQNLLVRKHWELYFRVFVFARPEETPDDEPWQEILRNHPKIQLWPVDRRSREVAFQNGKTFSLRTEDEVESFRYVWKERIVACGKNALRRLTPKKKTRFGFHGEQIWSPDAAATTMRPDVTIQARDVICCCSDRCFYIISDHDSVTATYNGRKSFPLPIGNSKVFHDACWPHAMACHQLDSLEQITIGFGFQRMTLHFSSASAVGGFTYILLTCSKVETVALFKRFQELSNNARENMLGSPGPTPTLNVENDDPHVLESIGRAVLPDTLGTVLRYQIVLQRWRHGDRGNVRRVCVLTDTKLYLLDEDYIGDGSLNTATGLENSRRQEGQSTNRLVDTAELHQITEVQAADADPKAITIVINVSAFARSHNWRLLCRTGETAEKLVEEVRKAIENSNVSV